MGIHGIYKEIGPGLRIALSKFAVQKFEQTGRPLRLAIDTSIWLFQIQSSKGGTNPALRTFFYRLLRLMSFSIHPLFVFDGPNKPPFKRHKRTGVNVASIPEYLAKQLLKQFGFPYHLAPGEAEAECALLQREGIVDAVLSEDVDTLMFGSGVTLRNWSAEGKEKSPSHVNVYDAVVTKEMSKLDREGMVLIALMSGGDYIPEGIPGCGPKTACEAARAGFGQDLCAISRRDKDAYKAWREKLSHELRTNESKFFRTKHAKLDVPEDFPNREVLGYYTNPVVSSKEKVEQLRDSLSWDLDIDYAALREFTSEAFAWTKLGGAKHFIRNFAPPLLVRELRMRGGRPERGHNDLKAVEEEESKLITSIHGSRTHASTDGITELRVAYVPHKLVPIDLDAEEPDDEFPQLGVDEEDEGIGADEDGDGGFFQSTQAPSRAPTKFDPMVSTRMWIPEIYVKLGTPLKVQDWEAGQRRKGEAVAAKAARMAAPKAAPKAKKSTTYDAAGMPRGALNKYAVYMKPGVGRACRNAKSPDVELYLSASQPAGGRRPANALSSINVKAVSSSHAPTRRPDILSLLSSSPSRAGEAEDAPTGVEMSSMVTKRRRRSPLRRSQTSPAELLTPRPAQQERLVGLDTPPAAPFLDLAIGHNSPSPLPQMKRTKVIPQSYSSPGKSKAKQTTISLLTSSPQRTIDHWIMSSPKSTRTEQKPEPPKLGLPSLGEDNLNTPDTTHLQIRRVQIETNGRAVEAISQLDLRITSDRRVLDGLGTFAGAKPVDTSLTRWNSQRKWPRTALGETSGNELQPRQTSEPSRLDSKAKGERQPVNAKPGREYIRLGWMDEGFWETFTVVGKPPPIEHPTKWGRGKVVWPMDSVHFIDLTTTK